MIGNDVLTNFEFVGVCAVLPTMRVVPLVEGEITEGELRLVFDVLEEVRLSTNSFSRRRFLAWNGADRCAFIESQNNFDHIDIIGWSPDERMVGLMRQELGEQYVADLG